MTDIPLKEHLEALAAERDKRYDERAAAQDKAVTAALAAQKEAVAAALAAADKAVEKAEANAEKWRENANEWRGAMDDLHRNLPTRREVEAGLAPLVAQVETLTRYMTSQQGGTAVTDRRKGISTQWQLVLFSAVIALVVFAANGKLG